MGDDAMTAHAHQLLKAAGEPTRLRLLGLLRRGPTCVCDLQKSLAMPQSTVSRHLAYLRAAGMVVCERRGPRIEYALARPTTRPLRSMMRFLEEIDASR
jgi:ArsR family transcriptional regulator, arsenate/arsenite/antimonite-responsive transcriptional repressor